LRQDLKRRRGDIVLYKLRSRLTYANVIATIAMFVALGTGGAVAANTVFSTDIVDGEVKQPDIATGAVTGVKVRANAIHTGHVINNSLTGDDVGPNAVGQSELADGSVTPPKEGTKPGARAVKSGSQSVPSFTSTTLSFESESFDTGALHDTTVDNSRLTTPIKGVYVITAGARWKDGPTDGDRILGVLVNGGCCHGQTQTHVESFGPSQTTAVVVALFAGDYVEASVYHTSATSPLEVLAPDSTFLSMTWVGPST
jgi:hypothetical protein